MQLYLIRHAQPLIGSGTCYGQTDMPADAAETAQSAQALADILPHGTPVFFSTLQRCELLKQYLSGLRTDLPSKPDVRLLEMDFGQWEGLAWNVISRNAIDAWALDFADYRVGCNGESTRDVVLRTLQALVDMHQPMHQPHLTDQGAIAWITHAGVIRAVQWLAGSLPDRGGAVDGGANDRIMALKAGGPPRRLAACDWPPYAPAPGHWLQLQLPALDRLRWLQQGLEEPRPVGVRQ